MSAYLQRPGTLSNEGSVSVTPSAEDRLVAQETALFGPVSEYEEVGLPPPPFDPKAQNGTGVNGVDANGKRLNSNANSNRAKRPKIAKPDVTPRNKVTGRRSMVTASGQIKLIGQEGDIVLPNNDYCDACHSKGQFLCCEGGCLRSFHFHCLDPPVDLEDLPDESWFCKACRAEHDPPLKFNAGIFRELIYQVDCTNPKAFALPADIKTFFLEVTSAAGGDFVDTREHRLPSKVTQRGSEDRDGFRVRDKQGKTLLCYQCNESASIAKHRRIVACDFCDQSWHLDCLDPPMSGMPPPTRKWMCPVHSDHTLPKVRHTKNITTIDVKKRYEYNNGDITIIPRREHDKIADEFDELTVNRIRYQVPEDTVILDFWGRAQNGFKPRTISAPIRKSLFDQFEPIQRPSAGSQSSGGESPLTSLGDLSDIEYAHPKHASSQLLDTSALDDLALLADGYYASLHFDREKTATVGVDTSSSTIPESVPSNKITLKLGGARSSTVEATSVPSSAPVPILAPVMVPVASRSPIPAAPSALTVAPTPVPVAVVTTQPSTATSIFPSSTSDKGKGREFIPSVAAPVPAPAAAPVVAVAHSPVPARVIAPVPARAPVAVAVPAQASTAPPKVAPVPIRQSVAAPVPVRQPRPMATPIFMSTSAPVSFQPAATAPGTPKVVNEIPPNVKPKAPRASLVKIPGFVYPAGPPAASSRPQNSHDMDTTK